MSNEPDYGQYSLDELNDAHRRIDAMEVPERAARLEKEIAARAEQFAKKKLEDRSAERRDRLPRKTIGIALIVSGVISLARTLDSVDPAQSFAVVALVAGLIYGSMIVAGACILRRWRFGLKLGLGVCMIQIPYVQVWRIGYLVAPFPASELVVWPPISVTFTLGNRIALYWSETAYPLYLGINLTAAVLASSLFYHLDRRRRAQARLDTRNQSRLGEASVGDGGFEGLVRSPEGTNGRTVDSRAHEIE